MQTYFTLVRRELGGFFVSLTGYVVIAGVLFLLGLSFSLILKMLNGEPFDQPITEVFYTRGLFWLILLLSAPMITMRTFALEKFSGTYETLMTAPVSDLEVVLAKFTGSMVVHVLLWLPLLSYPFILRQYCDDPVIIAPGPMASTFLGIFLLGGLYMSLGCFASSLTRSQLVAAMVAFAIGLVFFLLSFLSFITPPQSTWESELLTHISLFEHMRDFSRGLVDTRHVVFYVSLTVFFLFLTLKVVASRRWK
jgi:ABC-2 type transport system permease protein